MTKFSELNLDSTFAAAVIATGLAFAWAGSAGDSAYKQAERIAAEDRVTISQDDARFRVTVTAQRPRDFVPVAHQAATARPEPART